MYIYVDHYICLFIHKVYNIYILAWASIMQFSKCWAMCILTLSTPVKYQVMHFTIFNIEKRKQAY